MTELNNTIAQVSDFPSVNSISELLKIFVQFVDNSIQCSDLTDFPEAFD